jgi:hypothetical protein
VLKHIFSIAVAALVCSGALATEYYVVVPVKGRAAAAPAIAISLNSAVLPNAEVGEPYTYDLKPLLTVTGDSGYTGAGVVWAAVGTSLPPGLSLSAAGTISGIPSVPATVSLAVRASYKGSVGEQTFQLTTAVMPNLKIVSATYGGNAGTPTGNRTSYVGTQCNGRATCTLPSGSLYGATAGGDPYVGRAKDLVISYRCSGVAKPTYTAGAEAGTAVHTLSCP